MAQWFSDWQAIKEWAINLNSPMIKMLNTFTHADISGKDDLIHFFFKSQHKMEFNEIRTEAKS